MAATIYIEVAATIYIEKGGSSSDPGSEEVSIDHRVWLGLCTLTVGIVVEIKARDTVVYGTDGMTTRIVVGAPVPQYMTIIPTVARGQRLLSAMTY